MIGLDYNFNECETVLHEREIKKSSKTMLLFVAQKRNHSNEINKTGSYIIIYKPRSDFSTDRVLVSSTRADHNEKRKHLIKSHEILICSH